MEPTYLKELINVRSLQGNPLDDVNSPFAFLEWKKRAPAVSERDAVYHYNNYTLKWFEANKEKPITQKFVLKQKYLYLLDQLELFFSTEEKNQWYSQINLADEKELLLAIPFFARKLKDIALYYLKLRKRLKEAKLKYNAVGTGAGLEQEIRNYMLEAFSLDSSSLTPELYSTVPAFSALQSKLSVQIQELYDDKQYFDLSPTKPVSGYFDLMHEATGNFLATKGIVLSSSHWLFESFNVPVSTNFDSVFSSLTGRIFETTDADAYNSFIQKYLGQNKNLLTFGEEVSATTITNIDITEGNNFFYYPYGSNQNTFNITKQIPIVALSSLPFNTFLGVDGNTFPKAGSTLEDSDVVFVKAGEETKAAWLRYQDYEEQNQTVKAAIRKDSTTQFIFPFPGYGLSGNDFGWTGSNLESTAEYDFLSRDYKAAVSEAYWSQTLPLDSCDTLLLNNSNLAESGANSSNHPQHADQLFIRTERDTNTSVPFKNPVGAWFYKFTKTALPITPNHENVFLWPYCWIDEENFPNHIEKINFKDACNPVPINELSKTGFIAASSFDLADKIYKIHKYADTEEEASECAWLSGASIIGETYAYIKQDAFNVLFTPNEIVRFVWTGPTSTLEDVFKTISHRKDCAFVTNSPKVSALEWQKCTCKQVYHTPFGHPYSNFHQGNDLADCIFEATNHTLDPIDIGSWRDSLGNTIQTSTKFAWYRTNNKIGWGDGKWVTNILSASPLFLETGKCYYFKRASYKFDSVEDFPVYAVNYAYPDISAKWVTAKKNIDEEWSGGEDSTDSSMILNPGDFIRISRQSSTTSYVVSSQDVEIVSSNNNSVWSTYDTIPYICGQQNGTTISWPILEDPFDPRRSQYPTTTIEQISSYYGWTITRDEDGESQSIYGVPYVTFVPPSTGTYSISVTANVTSPSVSSVFCTPQQSAAFIDFALKKDFDKEIKVIYNGTQVEVQFSVSPLPQTQPLVVSSIIPKISAINPSTKEKVLFEFTTPSSGFLLEHSLKGWNYNTGKPNTKSFGARPYWATIDVEKNSTTRFKGLYSWGYPDTFIDEYIPYNVPPISPIEIAYGNIVEYKRKGYSFSWVQPINYKKFVDTTMWCQISADTTKSSNLSGLYAAKLKVDPIVLATTVPSDILLSNIINGSPVEVYYHALNSFTWPVSVTTMQTTVSAPSAELYFVSQTPWQNSSNRFYPTISNIPVLENTYSVEDVGGYFLPQNLGASLFVNKEFDVVLKDNNLSGSILVDDVSVHIGGRGRTQQDQYTPYTWSENNQWMKEAITTGELAGGVKQNLTKVLQSFIPYQSNSEETALGLVTNQSRISPWGGYNDEEWTDLTNEPTSYTGVRNVSAWADSQVIKQTDKPVDRWSNDIYGNQYSLLKPGVNLTPAERQKTKGEIWTKTNDQIVRPGHVSLSAVFSPFRYEPTIFAELTGAGIKDFNCYFDTIFIETDSIIIYARLIYNYDSGTIDCVFDDTRYKYLSATEDFKFQFEQNWFFSSEKKIVSLYTEISGSYFVPQMYEIDLVSRKYTKIFPEATIMPDLTASLATLDIKSINKASMYYNKAKNSFLLSYTGKDIKNSLFVLDLEINYEEILNVTKIDYYTNLYDEFTINEPPIVTAPYLTAINIPANTRFELPVTVLNKPKGATILTHPTQVTAVSGDNYMLFYGTLPAGLHHVNYTIINSVGETTYCLTLSAL